MTAPRQVIARIQEAPNGTDGSFIITNLEGRGKHLYEKIYYKCRVDENTLKNWKVGTRTDKTVCHRSLANQFRLFLRMAPTGCCTVFAPAHRSGLRREARLFKVRAVP